MLSSTFPPDPPASAGEPLDSAMAIDALIDRFDDLPPNHALHLLSTALVSARQLGAPQLEAKCLAYLAMSVAQTGRALLAPQIHAAALDLAARRQSSDQDANLLTTVGLLLLPLVASRSDTPRALLDRLLLDLETHVQRSSFGRRSVLLCRLVVAGTLGDRDAAGDLIAATLAAPRGELAYPCSAHEELATLEVEQRHAPALPVVSRLRRLLAGANCGNIHARAQRLLLLPLLAAGESLEALRLAASGLPDYARSPSLLDVTGQHLAFLCRAGEPETASAQAPAVAAAAFASEDEDCRLGALLGVEEALVGRGLADVTLLARARNEIDRLAAAFDARNGNDFYSRRVARERAAAGERNPSAPA